jgi:hypothetical protein
VADARPPKKERAKVLEGVKSLVPSDIEGAANYPLLVDLLMPRYEDSALTRAPATLRLKAVGTCWQVAIECPTEGVQCVVGLLTVHNLLEQLELTLGSGQVNWSETWEIQKRARQAMNGNGKMP